MPNGQTICLNMIVKNEAHVIRRCLASVAAFIDHWVIVDTGSTDGTQGVIREVFADLGLPGRLYQRPWRDFARNRSEALALARPTADYTFIIDADDVLERPPGFEWPRLTADSYTVDIHDVGVRYQRPQLVRNALVWRYRGVLHEFLTCDGAAPAEHLPLIMHRNHDGARRRDPQTYVKDAALLEAALETETDAFLKARYTFYLAQSYRDCGEREKALAAYLKRADRGFWDEEVFFSLLQAARLQEALEHPVEAINETYVRAMQAVPARAGEALHGLSRLCRLSGRNEDGYQYAKQGLDIPPPEGGLFVDRWIYDYGLWDELSINAYWSGHYRDSLDGCLRVLASASLPADQRQRVAQNARFSLDKTRDPANLGSLGGSNLIDQHALTEPRRLRSRVIGAPRILLAILAKQKEPMLPLYLECLEALDFPKSSIELYIRTNNNTDRTEAILREWVDRVGDQYAGVEFDAADVPEPVEQFGVHEWNPTRFRVLGQIRNVSLQRALDRACDFYFVCDVDNFIRPSTLRELVALDLPIVAPLLRTLDPGQFYSNFHGEIDANGYHKDCDQYQWILNRWVRGVVEVPVVHTTYLVRADVIEDLNYDDGTDRFEYVVFSDSARKSGVIQYLDNRQVYGYLAFDQGSPLHVAHSVDLARSLLSAGQAGG
jgi:tetratricopeptide (TPR) repeat protein